MTADMASTFVEVTTATESEESALELARLVVTARLAAGAQVIGPVKSMFWHLGEFGVGEEWRLALRTRADRFEALKQLLVEHHPWKNPEVLALRIADGSGDYLDWITKTLDDTAS